MYYIKCTYMYIHICKIDLTIHIYICSISRVFMIANVTALAM